MCSLSIQTNSTQFPYVLLIAIVTEIPWKPTVYDGKRVQQNFILQFIRIKSNQPLLSRSISRLN